MAHLRQINGTEKFFPQIFAWLSIHLYRSTEVLTATSSISLILSSIAATVVLCMNSSAASASCAFQDILYGGDSTPSSSGNEPFLSYLQTG